MNKKQFKQSKNKKKILKKVNCLLSKLKFLKFNNKSKPKKRISINKFNFYNK